MEGIINSKKSSTYQIDIFLKFISTQVFKNGLLILQWNFLQLRFGINLKKYSSNKWSFFRVNSSFHTDVCYNNEKSNTV